MLANTIVSLVCTFLSKQFIILSVGYYMVALLELFPVCLEPGRPN